MPSRGDEERYYFHGRDVRNGLRGVLCELRREHVGRE